MHKIKYLKSGNKLFWINKRLFDIIISMLLMPILMILCLLLMLLNKFLNPGPIIFTQLRMGKDCKPFKAIKFRTMLNTSQIQRKFDDPVEQDRITPLGRIFRKIRLDELPQIINVIKGDMSLIGPRPDYYDHALIFIDSVKGYRERHVIRPGISGLSQIRLGYAEGLTATRKKSEIDLFYIGNVGYKLELKIFFGTILTVFKGLGT
ncbi:sugar transferase [Amylibacter sp.]|nr:sugar transferase [Amylibacter sp.]